MTNKLCSLNKALSFIILSIYSLLAMPQKYTVMLGDTSLWNLTAFHFGYQNDSYYAAGDTAISGMDYKFLNGFHFMRNAMLREDTAGRKIYYWQKNGFRAGQDILLYDFSLSEGDSMLLYNPNTPLADSAGYFVLDSIREINVLNGKRRKFHLSQLGGMKKAEWIEGIGSTGLLTASASMAALPSGPELACFHLDKVHVYASDLATSFASCEFQTVGNMEEANLPEVQVFPNPASDFVIIRKPGGSAIQDVSLVDLTGRQADITIRGNGSELRIDLGQLHRGLYFLRVKTDLKTITTILLRQ